ncbi:MAG: ABC transporter substrate-binding protein [Betaproteobacteria bacterium]|nr:ABC transporter substrate-binding protein [Betaproteobacteria bacterium]
MLALRAGRPVPLQAQDRAAGAQGHGAREGVLNSAGRPARPGSASPARRRLLLLGGALLASPAAQAALDVRDDTGQELRLARPARRIVALSPQLVELCLAAGAGSLLVGTIGGARLPAAVRSLPRVGDAFGLNLEALAMLRPDLVLAWRSGTPPRPAAALRRLGFPVYWSETRDLRDVGETVLRIGEMAGTAAQARAWAEDYARRLRALREHAHKAGAAPLRVFFQAWPAPLMTIGGGQAIDRAIRLCGGVNVFGELNAPAAQVSREAVLARDPQLIVAATADPRALRAWQAFPQLSAVRHRRLVLLDPDGLPRMGTGTLAAVEQLCRVIDASRGAAAR